MDHGRRAAVGFALAGLGHGYVGVANVGSGFDLYAVLHAVTGLALLGAAGGCALLHGGRGLTLLAVGFVAAAVAQLLHAWGVGGLWMLAQGALLLGLLQAAWMSVLWRVEPEPRHEVRASGIGTSALLAALAMPVYLYLLLANNLLVFAPGTLLALVGYLLAARAMPKVPAEVHTWHRGTPGAGRGSHSGRSRAPGG